VLRTAMNAFEVAIERGEIDLDDFSEEHDVLRVTAQVLLQPEADFLVPGFAQLAGLHRRGLRVTYATVGQAVRRLFSVPLGYSNRELGYRVLQSAVDWLEANDR
jgi:hypothetical protein